MNSYVYVYMDPRKPGVFIYDDICLDYEPFYVGKGFGNRAFDHINEKRIVNTHKSGKINKIKKIGLSPIIFFIKENLTDKEAISIEILLIKKIGRYPNGPLTNLTDGGDGSLGRKRSIESIEKQKNSMLSNNIWLEKMKSEEFAIKASLNMKEYYSNIDNRERVSKRQMGSNNSMYGKKSSEKQKDSVKTAHREGRIKLSDDGRKNIIESSRKRYGKKNTKIKSNAINYRLTSPDGIIFDIIGYSRLQLFCKEKKLQLYVLKINISKTICEFDVIGKKIFAKNTVGWKLNKLK